MVYPTAHANNIHKENYNNELINFINNKKEKRKNELINYKLIKYPNYVSHSH